MFNPMPIDFSTMSDQELQDKILELQNRAMALRYHAVHAQMQTVIASYVAEFQRRKQENH